MALGVSESLNPSYTDFAQAADLAWMMTSSFLVFLMVPGIALVYSGFSQKESAHVMSWLPVMTSALVGLEVSHSTDFKRCL